MWGSQTSGTMTPSAPLPGGCSNLRGLAGTATLISKTIPAQLGPGGRTQFLTLEGWAQCPCPWKSQKAGVCGWESGEGGSSLGASGKMPPPSFPRCPPPVDIPSGLRQALLQGGHPIVAGCLLTCLQPHGLPAQPVGPCQLNQDTLIGGYHLRFDGVGADTA